MNTEQQEARKFLEKKISESTHITEGLQYLSVSLYDSVAIVMDEFAKSKAKIIAVQNDVSGNEANPSANKKDGEMAVAFAEWILQNNEYKNSEFWDSGKLFWESDNGKKFSSKKLYAMFKKETTKATDR